MLRKISGAVLGLLLATGGALAQSFPSKPLTMIIPFAAGGPTDVLGRVMAQRMSEILGQQVVVENVGGAGGMTGSKRVADAAPVIASNRPRTAPEIFLSISLISLNFRNTCPLPDKGQVAV